MFPQSYRVSVWSVESPESCLQRFTSKSARTKVYIRRGLFEGVTYVYSVCLSVRGLLYCKADPSCKGSCGSKSRV